MLDAAYRNKCRINALSLAEGAEMPRYHFIIQNGDPIADEFGVLLSDDQTARTYAMQTIHELLKDEEGTWGNRMMEVSRDGRVVWRIPFELSDPPG